MPGSNIATSCPFSFISKDTNPLPPPISKIIPGGGKLFIVSMIQLFLCLNQKLLSSI